MSSTNDGSDTDEDEAAIELHEEEGNGLGWKILLLLTLGFTAGFEAVKKFFKGL